jgi:TonB family protein
MRVRETAVFLAGFARALLCIEPAAAQNAEATPGKPAPAAQAVVTPPRLKTASAATYPPEALAQRLEGSVVLLVTIDKTGQVIEVAVASSAGHGFDEAAVEAAKKLVFEPATRGGENITSRISFEYPFHLPEAPSTPPVSPPTTPAITTQAPVTQEPSFSATALVAPPLSAASSFAARDRDFALRPIGSVQDILRVTPGLVLVQHSGGGKANQYFLRGFDVDHGTDLALSFDGVPINLVSHAHGQGYSDTNFIIPEVVERVEVTKGPYFASQADFATAGAVNLVSRDAFEHSSFGFGLSGTPGHGAPGYRSLLIASPDLADLKATFAAEIGRNNGPFENPERWDRFKLFNKLTVATTARSSLTVGEMSYGANWHGSGQLPARAVERGVVSRFGALDPSEGGNTARHQAYLKYRLRPTDSSELNALAYVGTYRFNLFSNFTLFLHDAERGDEVEQVDQRTFYGGRIQYRVLHVLGHVRFETRIGADGRSDDIDQSLRHTERRARLEELKNHEVHESFGGLFITEEITPTQWLRVHLGGRADVVSFSVDQRPTASDPGPSGGGIGAAHQLSPKASVVFTPLRDEAANLDLYVNYGHGFHSNDVRGAFAMPRVTPLTRAIGAELGARTRLFRRWDLAAALWQLDLENETVWSGEEGTTQVADATRRRGVEVETRYELTSWLAADLDVTFTQAAFRANAGNGNGLALAPKRTWSGGLSARHGVGPGVARAGVRFFGIAARPASDDGELTANGFTQVDLHLGYRFDRFDLALDIENLLNATFRSAQFATTTRLQAEPALGASVPAGFSCGRNGRLATVPEGGSANGFYGCEDVSYTPAYPFALRLLATVYLDR